MNLLMRGIKVPKLGSIQDTVYRKYLTHETQREVARDQLTAMILSNSTSYSTQNEVDEWNKLVKKQWNRYLGLSYNVIIPEQSEKEVQMLDYYQNKVKRLKPKLSKNKDGSLVVLGLETLKD